MGALASTRCGTDDERFCFFSRWFSSSFFGFVLARLRDLGESKRERNVGGARERKKREKEKREKMRARERERDKRLCSFFPFYLISFLFYIDVTIFPLQKSAERKKTSEKTSTKKKKKKKKPLTLLTTAAPRARGPATPRWPSPFLLLLPLPLLAPGPALLPLRRPCPETARCRGRRSRRGRRGEG